MNDIPQETDVIFDLRFNRVTAKHYYSRRRQSMQVRIDIDSKTIEGLGVTFSVEQAETLIGVLRQAVAAAKAFPVEGDHDRR